MILGKISRAVEALQQAGIPAGRSYPPQIQPALTRPVATVGLHRATDTQTVLQITVFSSPEQGGQLCESAAVQASAALQALGAQCTVDACNYDRQQGLLSVQILAGWRQGPRREVKAAGVAICCVTEVTAAYEARLNPIEALEEGVVDMRWEVSAWDVTVEQLLPPETPPEEMGVGTFLLEISGPAGVERYPDCRWVKILRQDTPQGIRQVRVARSWAEREVGNAEYVF